MIYFVYILKSKKTGRFYVGYTSNLVTRLEKHNAGGTISTRSGRPWEIVYYEKFDLKTDAISREKEIKRKKSKVYIESLIASGSSAG